LQSEKEKEMTLPNLSSLLENRITYATLLILFTLAICVNFMAGGSVPAFGSSPALLTGAEPLQNADANQSHQAGISPLPPPNPGDEAAPRIAISPLPPPNPWDEAATRIAISSLPPPNPWDEAATRIAISPLPPHNTWDEAATRIAISPLPPPNPWDEAATRIAISPLPPPNPWDEAATRIAISPLPPPNPWDEAATQIASYAAVSIKRSDRFDGSLGRAAWIRRLGA
jgi:hypothetical protein